MVGGLGRLLKSERSCLNGNDPAKFLAFLTSYHF